MNTRLTCLVTAVTMAAWSVLPALAQNAQSVDPKACAPQERSPITTQREGTQGIGSPRETLSEKLERSEGVICPPPGVDPEIVEPPRAGGRTPVIPPPGSPGGDPTVRPK